VPVIPGQPTFPVTFARSGLSVDWAPAHGSLLELAEACDVRTRWACRTGVCHTCITPVVSGEVEYVVPPLETPPPDEALVCCSRPATALVLDL
jgi:ferredoxin